jgi:ABC-type Fe3+ transport system permease subunit
MLSNVAVIFLISLAFFFGFIVLLRYLHHKEQMALIVRGIQPHQLSRQRNQRLLRAGLITAMVGLALTVGLYPLGFLLPSFTATPLHLGPWLLPGLIPLGVGIALIVSYYLEQNSGIADEKQEKETNVTLLQERRERERKEQ